MSKLNPDKLSVEFRKGVTAIKPIIPRRYTLTHSDITSQLFLTIGLRYAYDKINAMRDEVLGEWVKKQKGYLFYVYLYVDGQFTPETSAIRDYVFRRELPLALEAIRYGDMEFFSAHPELDSSPIMVHFMSTNPQYNKIENWGTFSDYNIAPSYRAPQVNPIPKDMYLLDMKISDVTGDGVPDRVSLYGHKLSGGLVGGLADNITVVIEDGRTNETKTITPAFNSGYDARLFLGDFTKDKVDDIKVTIDTGGGSEYGYFYIYSFKNNNFQEIFNFDKYNKEYKYKVDYAELYKVDIGNVMLDKLFVLDISYKGYDFLSQYYDQNGKLKKAVSGEVLSLSTLVPVVFDEKIISYDLMALERIIGISNSDTLGYIQNLLYWDGQKFASSNMYAIIPGTGLISPY